MSKTMPAGSTMIDFAGQVMALLPERAVWWPSAESLVIADLHLGKAASFRALGIPVPTGGTIRDLSRISALLQTTGAKRLVILGDFFHARAGRQPEVMDEITRWRKSVDASVLLIRGNHDWAAGRVLPEWNIREVDEPHIEAGIALVHHPEKAPDQPALAGHVHPVTSLRDFDGSIINIASFACDPNRMILPSFGSFTGGHKMHPREGRRLFLVMSGRVIEKKM